MLVYLMMAIFGVATFLVSKRMRALSKKAQPGLLCLEVVSTAEGANEILRRWKESGPDWQRPQLQLLKLDTWFICSYAPFLGLVCRVAADHLSRFSAFVASHGHWLAVAPLIAGACDFVENAGLRRTIAAGVAQTPWFQTTFLAAWTKWILIALSLLFAVAAICHAIFYAIMG